MRWRRGVNRLGDPRWASRPVGVIALESGFANQPYFNRTFRARFGMSPSDLRAQVRKDVRTTTA